MGLPDNKRINFTNAMQTIAPNNCLFTPLLRPSAATVTETGMSRHGTFS